MPQTKKDRVLSYLKTYGEITPKEAYEKFSSMRLADIIHELRKEGHNIITHDEKHNGGTHARYELLKTDQLQFL